MICHNFEIFLKSYNLDEIANDLRNKRRKEALDKEAQYFSELITTTGKEGMKADHEGVAEYLASH